MQFKELELKKEGSWFSRYIRSPRFRITIRAILIGAVAGFGFFYLTEGRLLDSLPVKQVINSMLTGAFFGFFITNSPCARGKC